MWSPVPVLARSWARPRTSAWPCSRKTSGSISWAKPARPGQLTGDAMGVPNQSIRDALDMAGERQHHDDEKDQAQSAAGSVAPVAAVAPGRQRSDTCQNKDDDQNCCQNVTVPRSVE